MRSILFALCITLVQLSGVSVFAGYELLPPEVIREPLILREPKEPAKRQSIATGDILRIAVWNVFKFSHQMSFVHLSELAERTDLLLLQEVIDHPQAPRYFELRQSSDSMIMARAFKLPDGRFTGVGLVSEISLQNSHALASPVTEPFTSTPKTSLYAEIKIADRDETLLIANVHMINFVRTSDFEQHLKQVENRLSQHKGPILFAGDFNTWNSSRMVLLQKLAERLGLGPAYYPTESLLRLDHVFYRGFWLKQVKEVPEMNTSDHSPIEVQLELSPK